MKPVHDGPVVLSIRGLQAWYGTTPALKDITMDFLRRQATAIIGPSGCGKSTLLRCLNRLNDLIQGFRVTGETLFNGQNVYAGHVDPAQIRYRIGMVFQKPNPFPKSIYENVAFGPRINGRQDNLDEVVEQSLRWAVLWEEVKDRLHQNAYTLSGGQQQRLCIARALAVEPEVLLMDEPCSALDPASTLKIEELIDALKAAYTIVIVTHNMQQAARVADHTAFLLHGELVEYGPTSGLFTTPKDRRTEDYITGRFG